MKLRIRYEVNDGEKLRKFSRTFIKFRQGLCSPKWSWKSHSWKSHRRKNLGLERSKNEYKNIKTIFQR